MFNPDFYPTPPEVAALMLDPLDEEVWAAVNARYARIKGQVLPEQLAKKKPRQKRQEVAA